MNKNEFFVGPFLIDMKRNRVVMAEQIISMEPKVLEVLLVLAEHPGEVLSHQHIVERIWPGSVVVPNALQRCIAQLRKAFGDDAKKQQFIVTHAKKGYSLVADVSWNTKTTLEITNAKQGWIALAGTVALTLLILMLVFPMDHAEQTTLFSKLTPITSSDAPEYFATFSPNGRYLAFTREKDHDNSNLWVRDLQLNKESQISWGDGNVSEPTWSPNGERIAFIKESIENGKVTSSIASIYFPLAMDSRKTNLELYPCEDAFCSSVQWINDQQIVFISDNSNNNQIALLDINSKLKRVIYSEDGVYAYSLSYSKSRQQLGAMVQNSDKLHELFLFDITSGARSSVPFSPGKGHDYWKRWSIKWNANNDGFLTSTDSRLLHVSLTGAVIEQPIPTFKYVLFPEYHPDGKSIAMTLGYVDRDLSQFHWENSQISTSDNINRSIRRESYAQYKPNSDAIAFISDRSGVKQIWYSDGNELKQISDVNSDQTVVHFLWATDGNSLIALVNQSLFIADTMGNWNRIDLDLNVIKLFQWLPDNSLLIATHSEKRHHLVRLNLESYSVRNVFDGYVNWSQQSQDGTIYVSDQTRLIKRLGVDSSTPEHIVSAHKTASRFFLRDNSLYWLTTEGIVQSYSINNNLEGSLFHIEYENAALTDIKPGQNKALVTHSVSTNKEIVLLHN